jgi:hypothetical protein
MKMFHADVKGLEIMGQVVRRFRSRLAASYTTHER